MTTPLVSIIVPVYNGEEYLQETIHSILSQDYQNIELLLINDGSSDGSEKLIKAIAENESKIRYYSKENGGVACARNYGIDKAQGDLIAFCDQDDLWLPTKLSKQVPLFGNPKVGLVYTGAVARYVEQNKDVSPDFSDKERGHVFDRLVEENMFTCCTVVARKSLIKDAGGLDDDRALMGVDDWHLWLKLALVSEFDYVEEHLAIHVFHGDNYSLNNEKMHKAELVCLEKIEEFSKIHNKSANWNDIKYRLHIRYAGCHIYTGLFNKASEAYFAAYQCHKDTTLFFKAYFFKLMPNIVLNSLQKAKRAIN